MMDPIDPGGVTNMAAGILNMAAGILDQPISHQEVLETGERVKGQFIALLKALVPKLAE